MNDPTFQTQAYTASLGQQSMAAQGQALSSLGSTAIDTIRYMQEMGQRREELNLRTQQWQVERQIQQQKLLEMQSIDHAEMSRLQIEGMRHQVDAAQIANDQAKFSLDRMQRTDRAMPPAMEAMLKYGSGLSDLMEQGFLVSDPSSPFGARVPKDKTELEASRQEALTWQEKKAAAHMRALDPSRAENAQTLKAKASYGMLKQQFDLWDESPETRALKKSNPAEYAKQRATRMQAMEAASQSLTEDEVSGQILKMFGSDRGDGGQGE